MVRVTDEEIGRRLYEDAKAIAAGTAKLAGPAPGTKKYTNDEIDLLWNEEAPGWTIEKELALLAEGKSRRAVGLEKFPHRKKLMESGERVLDKYAQFKFAYETARRNDPTWDIAPPPGSQPPTLSSDMSDESVGLPLGG